MVSRKCYVYVLLLVFSFAFIVAFTGCNSNDTGADNVSIENGNNTEVETSIFVGKWICLKENSCNNKKIVLTITQEDNELKIIRDMESNTSSGSKISFSVDVPTDNTFSSSDINGTYTLQDGILIESFHDGKANYYSSDGNISTNICSFEFCSEKCGDLAYCELHDTESKRYNSLTNSNKKSICYYIDKQYEYYDEINGGYAGDKYSDTIMSAAASKYGLSIEHINIIWMKYFEY